ncbi:MAG TPA: phosphatase PAP2 family protein [Gemmatimonadaceae bacterium]
MTRRLAVGGATIVAATLATMPFDVRIAEEMRDASPQRRVWMRDGARGFDVIGDPGVLVASAAMYGVGRLVRSPGLTAVGMHSGEAVVIGGATTSLLKLVAGRARPYASQNDAGAFTPGRVAGGHTSFPSGHTTVAFAFAAATTAEIAARSHRAAWIAGPALYGMATLVGGARMYDDKHWASDVVLGAGIGTVAGIETVAWNRAHPRNLVERTFASVRVTPARHGVAFGIEIASR